ncbi:MAG: phage terminase large subunit family protein, partial [Defluviitaleaceae bacterium]|nr:phage terminase large subunit family protein [Defluviitaleaceae bacterium]
MTITTNNTQKLFQQLICILTPPPKLTISEWADKYRVLSSEESASPGQWHNDFVPYMVEPMNAISDPFIKEVVLMCAAQTAKTNVMMNTIGYYMDSDPCPIMLVEPTIEVGESISREKIAPMLRDTPVLRKLFPDDKAKTTGNTIKEKSFPGGFLVIAGANSASS